MTQAECKIDGCHKPSAGRGMCHMHYRRWRKGQDLLAPQQIASPGEPLAYFLSLIGTSETDCILWPFARAVSGYAKLGGGTSGTRVMCQKAHGDPPSPKHDAAHSCGRGHEGCVNPNHLSWKTKKQNQADRITHGTSHLHILTRDETTGRFTGKREAR